MVVSAVISRCKSPDSVGNGLQAEPSGGRGRLFEREIRLIASKLEIGYQNCVDSLMAMCPWIIIFERYFSRYDSGLLTCNVAETVAALVRR